MIQYLTLFTCVLLSVSLSAQFGNHWIDFDKTYYKFSVAEDGIYRIGYQALLDAGLQGVEGRQFRLFLLGEEVPAYTTTEGLFADGDYIEFYGVKNRGELDRELYADADAHQLNPRFSMFTDTAAYFLTWNAHGEGLRITHSDNDTGGAPPAEPWYLHTTEWIYNQLALDTWLTIDKVNYSRYRAGEGFGTSDRGVFTLGIQSTMRYNHGPDAKLNVRMSTSNLVEHDLQMSLAGENFFSAQVHGFRLYQVEQDFPAGDLTNNMQLRIEDASGTGRFRVAVIRWTYARQPDFTGRAYAEFEHPGTGDVQHFALSNFDHSDADPVVYDRSLGIRLYGVRDGNTVRFVLPPYDGSRKIVIANASDAVHPIDNLIRRHFIDYRNDNPEYLIITHPALRSDDDAVAEYAAYRSSIAGGSYRTAIYDMPDLYDQFGYGIERHPESIRNFNRMINGHWPDIRMVVIIGRAVDYANSRHGQNADRFFVPTFGLPGADNLLFTETGQSIPPFPIGRIPVTSGVQLRAYLEKVKEHDMVPSLPQTLADKGWTKNVLHMGGGADASQQQLLLGMLNEIGSIATNAPFGAHVTTFTKSNTNAVGGSNSTRILRLLGEGVQIAKFFGHSSANTLDFQVNNPSEWNNRGKYPIFSAMGCKSGDIHGAIVSLSEVFVLEPEAGTIAFIAGSGLQFINPLAFWAREWYAAFSSDHDKGRVTLGESLLLSIQRIMQTGGLGNEILAEQMTLNGDPAILFYPSPGADFVWDTESVRVGPDVITTADSEFAFEADIVNIGANIYDSLTIQLEIGSQNGTRETLFYGKVKADRSRSTVRLTLPLPAGVVGLVTIYGTIDPAGDLEEAPLPDAKLNNTLVHADGRTGIDLYIADNRVRAAYPPEFAIVNDVQLQLTATATNVFTGGRKIYLEIDTTAQFNSPLLMRETVSPDGGVVKWSPAMSWEENTVYYWRTAADSVSGGPGLIWDVSSFIYMPDAMPGWNQSHFEQFTRDPMHQMSLNPVTRAFEFEKGARNIWVQNAVNTGPGEHFKFFLDNTNFPVFFRDWGVTRATVFVSVWDSITANPIFPRNPPGGAHGAINPFTVQRPVFPFPADTPGNRDSLMIFLEEFVPSGQYVIMHTYQRTQLLDYMPENWEADSLIYGRNLFSFVEQIYPESKIRRLKNGAVPYTIFYRKDHAAIQEEVAADTETTTNVDYNFPRAFTEGRIRTPLIGPASSWSHLEWHYVQSYENDADSIALSGYAISGDLRDSIAFQILPDNDFDLSWIDAVEYPYLRLSLYVTDPSDERTPPQLEYWRVFYEGLPEFIFQPSTEFTFEHDSIPIGDEVRFRAAVENISRYPSDVFPVRFVITDRLNNVFVSEEMVPALPPGGNAPIAFTRRMTEIDGDHTFLVELNAGRAVPEMYHHNNFGFRNFYVIPDRLRPQLSVTFDGRHLRDYDVVAANPEIVTTLRDENMFAPLSDPELLNVWIRPPSAFDFEAVDVLGADMEFRPSVPGEGLMEAQLIWRPHFAEDGYYAFRAAARDMAGNPTALEYEINFEVLRAPRIIDVYVKPNPFWDHTYFHFVLTGESTPPYFTLRITDAVGRTVREFTGADMGTAFIGTHAYDLSWDGTDANGNLLPSGVYFYAIEVKDNNGNTYPGGRKGLSVGKIVFVR